MINEENKMNGENEKRKMDLTSTFLQSVYEVFDPYCRIMIHEHNPDVDALCTKYGVETWTFVTAYNPGATKRDNAWNQKQNEKLLSHLTPYKVLQGVGRASDHSWVEPSFLVLGIGLTDALKLAAQFGQMAIIFSKASEKSRLVFV